MCYSNIKGKYNFNCRTKIPWIKILAFEIKSISKYSYIIFLWSLSKLYSNEKSYKFNDSKAWYLFILALNFKLIIYDGSFINTKNNVKTLLTKEIKELRWHKFRI